MTDKGTGLVGPNGEPVKTVNIPVVKFEDFVFPMHMVEREELINVGEEGVKPSEIIRELRAVTREMRHRFTILATGMVVASRTDKELKNFLDSIGLVITDAKSKTFFTPDAPETDKFAKDSLDINTPAQPQ